MAAHQKLVEGVTLHRCARATGSLQETEALAPTLNTSQYQWIAPLEVAKPLGKIVIVYQPIAEPTILRVRSPIRRVRHQKHAAEEGVRRPVTHRLGQTL